MRRREASLIDLLTTDLTGYRREDTGEGKVRFVPTAGGKQFEVDQREDRRFLGRTKIARFHTTHPGGSEPGAIDLRHTGRRRRTGVEAAVRSGGQATTDLADKIESDAGLAAAILPLDFTHFELSSDGDEWSTSVELMGASLVAMALPPIRSYVRLYPDQLEALTATFAELDRVLATGP